jgi:hypothetical protein
MTSTVTFFSSIAVDVPREQIYRRLGFRKDTTQLSDSQYEETEKYIEDARSLIRLRGAGRRMPITATASARTTIAEEIILESVKLAAYLKGCTEVVLMAATGGSDIMEAIQADAAGDMVTRGVVMDAAASEIVDNALDWIMGYYNRNLLRERKALLAGRFSAGYGDLALENQKQMYRLLELDKLGVQLTESCILVPEKSVTAIAGIRPV